jgi:hypothetical protein
MATRPTLRTANSTLADIDVSSNLYHIHLTILLRICCVSISLSIVKDEVQNRVGACAELEIRAGHVIAPHLSAKRFSREHGFRRRCTTGNKIVSRAHDCHEAYSRDSARRQTIYIMR